VSTNCTRACPIFLTLITRKYISFPMSLLKIACMFLGVALYAIAQPDFCFTSYSTPDGPISVSFIPNNPKSSCIVHTGEMVPLHMRSEITNRENECGNSSAGTAEPFGFPCNTKNDTCGQCCCDGDGTCICAQHYSSDCIGNLYHLEFNSTDVTELEIVSDVKIGVIAFGSLVGVVVVILMIIYCGL